MTGKDCNFQYLYDAISTVASQTLDDLELVFVSSDQRLVDTVESHCEHYNIIANLTCYPDLKTRFERFEVAVKNARGKWIVVLDTDDLLHPDALWTIYRCLLRNPLMDYFCGSHKIVTQDLDFICNYDAAPLAQTCNSLMHTFHQRHIWGFRNKPEYWPSDWFDGDYPVEDYWMFVRLAMNATPILHIPHYLYVWRRHPKQWTQTHQDECEEMIKRIQRRLKIFQKGQSPMWHYGDVALAVRLTNSMVSLTQEVLLGDDLVR